MIVQEPGHIYRLYCYEGTMEPIILTFVAKEPEHGRVHPGTRTQEVLRALIDRTQHCDSCLRHPINDEIIYHLRQALVLHEARALERKVEKGTLNPEDIETSTDGHFILTSKRDLYSEAHGN